MAGGDPAERESKGGRERRTPPRRPPRARPSPVHPVCTSTPASTEEKQPAPSSTTDPCGASPSRRSRCARWSGPRRSSGRRATPRARTTSRASATATAPRQNTTAALGPASYPARVKTTDDDSTNPVNSEPQAPSPTRAGYQLCIRKPVSAAATTLSSTASPSITSAAAQAPAPKAVTTPTVPASPSAWSSPLKARVARTIQPMASSPPGAPVSSYGTTQTAATAVPVTSTRARSRHTSATRPSPATAAAAMSSRPTPSPSGATPVHSPFRRPDR
ncbi:hypothetical protein SCANM63S_08363 [Streptomyces canarius]